MATRGDVSFTGIGNFPISYPCRISRLAYEANVANGSAHVGKAVCTQTPGAEIELSFDGWSVLGQLGHIEDDNVAEVNTRGFMTFPIDPGKTLVIGYPIIGGEEDGTVRTADPTSTYEICTARGQVVDLVEVDGVDSAIVWMG